MVLAIFKALGGYVQIVTIFWHIFENKKCSDLLFKFQATEFNIAIQIKAGKSVRNLLTHTVQFNFNFVMTVLSLSRGLMPQLNTPSEVGAILPQLLYIYFLKLITKNHNNDLLALF